MFKNYKRMYIEERGEKFFYKERKEYYERLADDYRDLIKDYKAKIADYETTCKKTKRLSDIGFWCGIASIVFITVSAILKAVL